MQDEMKPEDVSTGGWKMLGLDDAETGTENVTTKGKAMQGTTFASCGIGENIVSIYPVNMMSEKVARTILGLAKKERLERLAYGCGVNNPHRHPKAELVRILARNRLALSTAMVLATRTYLG